MRLGKPPRLRSSDKAIPFDLYRPSLKFTPKGDADKSGLPKDMGKGIETIWPVAGHHDSGEALEGAS
jgi:hypothetical protein